MPYNDPELVKQIIESVFAGLLGLIGAIASFFYEVDKGRKAFTFKSMFFTSFIGFVMGTAAGSFIPAGENWYGWTVVIGINAYPIMSAMKERAGPLLNKLLNK